LEYRGRVCNGGLKDILGRNALKEVCNDYERKEILGRNALKEVCNDYERKEILGNR